VAEKKVIGEWGSRTTVAKEKVIGEWGSQKLGERIAKRT
jgi:hypothetical protein